MRVRIPAPRSPGVKPRPKRFVDNALLNAIGEVPIPRSASKGARTSDRVGRQFRPVCSRLARHRALCRGADCLGTRTVTTWMRQAWRTAWAVETAFSGVLRIQFTVPERWAMPLAIQSAAITPDFASFSGRCCGGEGPEKGEFWLEIKAPLGRRISSELVFDSLGPLQLFTACCRVPLGSVVACWPAVLSGTCCDPKRHLLLPQHESSISNFGAGFPPALLLQSAMEEDVGLL